MMARGAPTTATARQRGAATVEFYLIAFWVLVPLLMGILQLGLFMVAKNTVNVAALNAARAGAASGINPGEMRNAFLQGILPLYASHGMERVGGNDFVDVSNNYGTVTTGAYLAAAKEWALSPVGNRIIVLNPRRAAFDDFGINRASDRQRIIPVENLMSNNAAGSRSGQLRSDALLLKIEANYCYRMVVPIIDTMIISTLRNVFDRFDAAAQDCYLNNAILIRSQAVVRMTVPPIQANVR
ncbi:TadE family protein [Massilia sp. CF038]|uniref:TadE family protein n=1 Tax=Massilia sp. CF038 TaxID=1881045 RepID=UPI00091A3DA9|nr:TadE family protein [Massilia sp. CF038]SHH24708.1 TadE-like protein [Massilia sp. CF038]